MPLDNAALVARLNEKVPPTARLLGQEVLEVDQEQGWARLRFLASAQFCNPMGHVQGGFVAAMLDDAAAIAAIVKAQAPIVVPTLEFKTSFFAPASAGVLFAEGRVLKLGKRVAFLEAKLFDPHGKLLAIMSVTAMPAPLPDKPNLG
jgi:uncharacterized protein (TIGR00369 family)